MPMGCAVCGHAPYAHGCPGQPADHEYAQPSGELMAERLDARRRLGLGRPLPPFEHTREVPAQPTPLVPAPRQVEPDPSPSRVRRPAAPNAARPYRPVESQEDRTARLVLARDSLALRRARATARTQELIPYKVGTAPHSHRGIVDHKAMHPHREEPAPRRTLTLSPNIPNTGDRHQPYQTLSRGSAVAPGWGRSPDTFPPRRHDPYRHEAAA